MPKVEVAAERGMELGAEVKMRSIANARLRLCARFGRTCRHFRTRETPSCVLRNSALRRDAMLERERQAKPDR